MIPTSIDGGLYLRIFILVFLFLLLVFRKQFWNIIDPFIILLFNIAFNISIAFYTHAQGSLKDSFLLYICLATLAFIAGFFIIPPKLINPAYRTKQLNYFIGPNKFNTKVLISVCILFITINNIFLIKNIGLGVITGAVNPDLIKVTLTQGGGGIFQKLNWASKIMFIPLCAYAYFALNMKKFVVFSFAYFLISTVLFGFSKGGLIFLLFDFSIVAYYFKDRLKTEIINIKKIMLFGLLGIFSALIVLANVTAKYGVSIADLLAERFVATGAGTYQFFSMEGYKAFDDFTFADKIRNYFDVTLSTFKLKEWEPLSYVAYMTEYLSGLSAPGFGANTYIFVDGYFLFGWGGLAYCFFMGILLKYARYVNMGIISFFVLNTIVMQGFADPGISQHTIIAMILFLPFLLIPRLVSEISNKRSTLKIQPL